jgi:hypothetical protein
VQSNVFVSVPDPQALYDGQSPFAPFAVRYILLYRFPSEASARAGTGGTLVEKLSGSGYTWELVPASAPVTPEDGPYRYGVYDPGQVPGSWYRYRFAAADFTVSQWSEPWEADSRVVVSLRDILFEVGMELGGLLVAIDCSTNASASEIVSPFFRSAYADPGLYEGWWVLVADAGGLAPEGEWAMVSSVDGAVGRATLDRSLSAPATAGHRALLTAAIQPSELIRLVNRAREKMQVIASQEYAVSKGVDRFRVPLGVQTEKDVIEVLAIAHDREFPIDWRVEFDGPDGWVYSPAWTVGAKFIKVRYLTSYRYLEGPLVRMSDATSAPLEWIRPAVAYSVAEYLARSDPAAQEYQALVARLGEEATAAASRYGPDYVRSVRRGHGRRVVAGPREV